MSHANAIFHWQMFNYQMLWKFAEVRNFTINNPTTWHAFIIICRNSMSSIHIVRTLKIFPMISGVIATKNFKRFGQDLKFFFWKFKPITSSVWYFIYLFNHAHCYIPSMPRCSEFFSNSVLKSTSNCNFLQTQILAAENILRYRNNKFLTEIITTIELKNASVIIYF